MPSLYDDPGTLYDVALYDDDAVVDPEDPPGPGDLEGALKTTTLLNAPFDSAFYSGSSVTTDAPYIFQVALGGHQYRIDPKQYERNTLPTLRPPQDNSTEPGEQSLNTESVWRRSCGDWILGSGQSYFDDLAEPASNRNQFAYSRGVDPWTRRQLTLLKDTNNILGASVTNIRLVSTPSRLYATAGTELRHTTDPESLAPTWTSVTDMPGTTIDDVTTIGSTLYAACGPEGIYTTAFGTTSASSWSAYAATLIEFANGFLIAAKDGEVVTISNSGTASAPIYTHFDDDMRWVDIEATPQGAYIAGNSQGKAELYYIGLDTSTGELLPPTYAGGLPDGETILQLAFYQGLMLLGTSRGLRLADIDNAHGINYGPLIAVPGGVTALEPQGEYCWFSWSNFDQTRTGLGRVNLARNSEPGIPAYASDLMAVAQGTVTGIATFGDRRYFGVNSSGVYGEADFYVATGVIDSGRVRFGTVERKVAVSLDVKHDPLPTQAGVLMSLVKDDGTVVQCGLSNDTGTQGPPVPYPTQQSQAEAMSVLMELRRGSFIDETPVVRRWTLRATPTPLRTDEIILPILLSEVVSTGEEVGQDASYDTLAEFQFLKNLEASRLVTTYQEGRGAAYSVQVDRVMVKPEKWNSKNTFFNGLVFVRLLTIGA